MATPSKLSVVEGAVQYYTTGKIKITEKILVSLFLLGYIVFPIDTIPDFFPIVGWLDDIGISCLALWYFNYRVAKVSAESQEKKENEAQQREKEIFLLQKDSNSDSKKID